MAKSKNCNTCKRFKKDPNGKFCGLTGKNVPPQRRNKDCVNYKEIKQ